MAVMQKIRELFEPEVFVDEGSVTPAPLTTYEIKPLTEKHIADLMQLSLRCFSGSESYSRETFEYLLREPNVLSYQVRTTDQNIVGFIFILLNNGQIAHITTIAIAPEHRKRGLAQSLVRHAEKSLAAKEIDSMVLEVRLSNFAAQNLYSNMDFVIIQKLSGYYNDGEDAYLMCKSIVK